MTTQQAKSSSLLLARKTLELVVEDPRLPHMAIALWATLLRFSDNDTGECYPSHKTLMQRTQIKSKATLIKYLNLLRETGYILIESGRQEHKVNNYVVKIFGAVERRAERTDEEGQGANDCTSKPASGRHRVQSMNQGVFSQCTGVVQSMNTELTSNNLTQSNSSELPTSTYTHPNVPVSQQGRGEGVDHENGKAQELRKNPAFIERLKSLTSHLGSNIQGYEPEAMKQAKALLAKYGQYFRDRPLHTTEVTDFLEAFYASRRWKAPVFEEIRDLVDNLVSTLSHREFKTACQQIELSFLPHWKNPPTFQTFVDAAREGQGDEVMKLMLSLKNNIGACETRGYPSRSGAYV